MKQITLLLLFFIGSTLFAQKSNDLQKANQYLAEKGEVIFSFKAANQKQFFELNEILSVSHRHVDQKDLQVEAYANKEQFKKFLTYGLPFTVKVSDNEIAQEIRPTVNGKIAGTWDTTWDAYPQYSEYVAKLNYWVATYPTICKLENIGATPNGRALYVLKISDNSLVDETEPEFLYTSSMHGDEITGYPTMLHFIDYLLTNYGAISEVTDLVNGTEIFICPLANPDGSYKTAGNDIMNSVGNTATRGNAAGVDMNRNYPDPIGGIHPDGLAYQTETLAFMNFEKTRNFVLSANYHGGAEVINFPWDTSNSATGSSAVSIHPHDNYFKYVSTEYAQLCQTADGDLNYMDDVYSTGQFPGTTNGAIWYTVKGGRQDWNNFFNHNKEVTVEISATKFPLASTLPFFWDRNRQALINYIKQASYGIQGVVSNADGNPIHAKVYIAGTLDNSGAWVETSATKGDYHKVQIAGTYNVIFEAPGYTTQTISATITNGVATVLNVTMVPLTALPIASNDVTICQGQTTSLTATGTGTIKWYDSINATSAIATGTPFTTPPLSTTTSYYAESEVTPANVGPTSVSGTATSNTTVANKYVIFNCTTPTKLKSVLITNSGAGQLLVELQDSTGKMLESKVVFLTTTGSQDIALDFFLPVATSLRLVSRQISGFNLTCITAKSAITYPMTSGAISITGSSVANGNNTFFQFFNWKFEPIRSNREEVIINVNPTSVAGTVSANQNICSGSQPASINLTGNTGTIQWQSSSDNSNFFNIIGETTNTLSGATIGALTASKYFKAIVTSGVCSSIPSATVSVIVPTTTWTGSSWNNGVPTSTSTAIITNDYNVSANINACTLTVNNNAIVTIPSDFNVTLNGALTVSSGSFTLNNNANLIQLTNSANSGNIIIKRETAPLMRLDYAMWSSPVTNTNQYLKTFSPLTLDARFYTYNPSSNVYNSVIPTTTNFTNGTGYLIRLPNDHSETPLKWTGTFTGIPNNGDINFSVANGTYNAIGNPYPSTINANTFISINGISEALYFWRKTNNSTSTSYATYTLAGGVGTSANPGDTNGIIPNGIIQVGQGFIAKSTSNSIQFTNLMRVANNQDQFLRTKAIERNRIWLNLSNETTALNQMMVAYMTGATQNIDPTIDGRYINDSQTALNSLLKNEEFVIQGRSVPFDPTDVVPLAFKTTTSGNYTISIDHVDGLFLTSQDIILIDNNTGTETNLKASSYLFAAVAGVDNARFSLKYQKTLNVNSSNYDENTISVHKNNGAISIKSSAAAIENIKLFDIAGRLLFEKKKVNSTETAIESIKFANQVLIVQITTADKSIVNKKVVN